MIFTIDNLVDDTINYTSLNLDKNYFAQINSDDLIRVELDFNCLNLGEKLYGKTKNESINIQKNNSKKILSYYKIIKKFVKKLKRRGISKISFFVKNLSDKKNNNDIMLIGLLEVDFNAKLFSKMKVAYEYSCDFLDAENSLNKMCDFHDNHCTKHRDKNIDKTTGCCPSFCKIRVSGQACSHKNLACKIFMCDYLINEKGFYFTPNTLAILQKHMSPLERAICFGTLCRTEKKSLRFLWLIRGITFLYFIVILCAIFMLIF